MKCALAFWKLNLKEFGFNTSTIYFWVIDFCLDADKKKSFKVIPEIINIHSDVPEISYNMLT